MSLSLAVNNIKQVDRPLTVKEMAFITAYIANGFNGTEAAREAGYKANTTDMVIANQRLAARASGLLRQSNVQVEMTKRLQEIEDAKIAKPTEILQFYSSVMRGEQLDQFGIEASLDTRIKAANELAKHQIELPMKLEQKNITNNIGSISLNFIPRKDDIDGVLPEIPQITD